MAARDETYSFRQEPRAVRARYRGQPLDDRSQNIMYDKRVVRGNTYAVRELLQDEQDQRTSALPFGSTIRRRTRRKQAEQNVMEEKVPSHELLEELTGPAVSLSQRQEEYQNSAAEELHPTAYMPKAPGTDQGTSIEDSDLFDFDLSVLPILEVLIGKSLDQGELEVVQEEQVKMLKHNKGLWEAERNITYNESQRLQAELQRHQEERDRRLAQGVANVDTQAADTRAHAAKTTAKNALTDIQETVMRRLAKAGHFYDPTVNQIEGAFVPWLVEKLVRELNKEDEARKTVDSLITGACAGVVEEVNAKLRAEQAAIDAAARAVREAEEERLRLIREEEERILQEEADKKKAEMDTEKAAELAAQRAQELFDANSAEEANDA